MSELITNERDAKKKQNTKFWIVAGIWMLIIIITLLSNNSIANGDS